MSVQFFQEISGEENNKFDRHEFALIQIHDPIKHKFNRKLLESMEEFTILYFSIIQSGGQLLLS